MTTAWRHRASRRDRLNRGGMTSVEVLLALSVLFTIGWSFLQLGFRACAVYVHQAVCLVGWPYL